MEQEVFVHAYEVVRPIVLKASRQYFIQLWDLADMEQEAMMTLYQLLEKFPELKSDDDKLRRYFKTKFRNRLNDEVRRQESVKRQANRQCYIEISDIAFCLPNKELDAVDRLVYDEQLNAFRNQLSSEDATKLDRLLAGECFRGRKKMIRELKTNLYCFITILFDSLLLNNNTWSSFYYSYRNYLSIFIENLSHPYFLTDYSFFHVFTPPKRISGLLLQS